MSNTMTFVLVWILLSFPIVHNVSSKMKAQGDEFINKAGFQLYLFIRAQFEVPRFYIRPILQLLTKRN